jgi:hypothetical protein
MEAPPGAAQSLQLSQIQFLIPGERSRVPLGHEVPPTPSRNWGLTLPQNVEPEEWRPFRAAQSLHSSPYIEPV